MSEGSSGVVGTSVGTNIETNQNLKSINFFHGKITVYLYKGHPYLCPVQFWSRSLQY